MSLRQDLIHVLKDEHTRRIAFGFGPVSLNAAGYLEVATALKAESIGVAQSSHMPSDGGRYYYKPRNRFVMGFGGTGADVSRKALVVHESSHASFDLRSATMKVKESEAGAYIAQALYFYYAWGFAEDDTLEDPTFSTPILTAAWRIAKTVAGGGSVSDSALATLYHAIGADPQYAGRLDNDEDFNG